jgi:hypothetical protein
MRITNRVELHPWRSTGPGPVPVTPAADALAPVQVLIFAFSRSQGDASRPRLAPAKALRSDASMPTRRRSSRAPRAAGSAAATGEPPHGTAVAMGPQQEVAPAAAATAAAIAATSASPALETENCITCYSHIIFLVG